MPHVSMAMVMPVIAADMTGHPPLHEGTEGVGMSRLQHGMKMIRHQTKAKDFDGILAFGRDQQIQESPVVPVFVESHGAAIATIQHMVRITADLSTRDTRHDDN